MPPLIVLPSKSDAFSAYVPSKNAHTDILTAAKRSDVKVVRLNMQVPAALDENASLPALEAAVPLLLAGKATPLSYHAIVDTGKRISRSPTFDARQFFARIDKELSKHVEGLARECRGSVMAKDKGWLRKIVAVWETFESRVDLVAALLVYLDRATDSDGTAHLPIRDRARAQFSFHIWQAKLLFEKTRDDFLNWVTVERESGTPQPELRADAQGVAKLAHSLDVFGTLWGPYLELTQSYYASVAEQRMTEVESGSWTGTEYVKWALAMEVDELRRTDELQARDPKQISNIMFRELAEKAASRVVPTALDEAMYRADTEALTRLYTLCTHPATKEAFGVFSLALRKHIEARIRTLIADPNNDPQMIESTLKLKRFVDLAVAALFETKNEEDVDMTSEERGEVHKRAQQERTRQLELEEAVRQGFKAGLGSRQNAPAEWIAKHLDATMRKGQGSGTEAEFNQLLDEIIALIGFTRDKDVFRAFYATGLAKRLLLNKSASDDMERNLIVKLQKEMGEEFTSGDVMMKDLQLSETLVTRYQSAKAKNPAEFKDHSDLTANVLTESAWPPYPLLKDGWNFKLTPQMQSSVDAFTTWYATQHQNRKLSWRHQLATVTLTARFDSGKYEIGVSLFQATVLLQFNEVDVLTFNDLKERTGIESTELVRTLQSLALGRKGTRVLLKRPAGKEVEPTDKFAFNKGFSSERMKFKINQIQQDLSAEESRKTNEQVAIDRVSVLEATIVRIMKGRKKLTLQLLIDAVVTDVSKRFPPDIKEIKKRMESLIEREFLMRDEKDRNTLHYLA